MKLISISNNASNRVCFQIGMQERLKKGTRHLNVALAQPVGALEGDVVIQIL